MVWHGLLICRRPQRASFGTPKLHKAGERQPPDAKPRNGEALHRASIRFHDELAPCRIYPQADELLGEPYFDVVRPIRHLHLPRGLDLARKGVAVVLVEPAIRVNPRGDRRQRG